MFHIRSRLGVLLFHAFISFPFLIYLHWRSGYFIADPDCKWPPSRPANVSPNAPFNLTLCVRPFSRLVHQSEPRYYFTKLFQVAQSFTFEDLADVSNNIWEKARYPEIYSTYPQNVPLKKLVQIIKMGKRVSQVSYSMLNIGFHCIKMTMCINLCHPHLIHDNTDFFKE